MSKSAKITGGIFVAAAIAAGVGGYLAFRGKPSAEEPVDPVAKRMSDPVYLKKLDTLKDLQKQAMKAIADAKRKLAAAEAANASAEELTALTNAVQAAYADFEKTRVAAQMVVRDQILSDSEATEQLKQQKKGK